MGKRTLISILLILLAAGTALAQESTPESTPEAAPAIPPWTSHESTDFSLLLPADWQEITADPETQFAASTLDGQISVALSATDSGADATATAAGEQLASSDGNDPNVEVVESGDYDLPASAAYRIALTRTDPNNADNASHEWQYVIVNGTMVYVLTGHIADSQLEGNETLMDRIAATWRIAGMDPHWTTYSGDHLSVMVPEDWSQRDVSGTIEVSFLRQSTAGTLAFQYTTLDNPTTLDTVEALVAPNFQQRGAQNLQVERVSLPIGEAIRAQAVAPVRQSSGSVIPTDQIQYIVVQDAALILVTYVGPQGAGQYDADTIAQIMQTLQLNTGQ